MKKSFAIIGLGRFGLSLLEELVKYTDNIIVIDKNKEAVQKASKFVNQCFIMESTNEKALKEKGISNVQHALVCFGNDLEATILTLVSLKNIGVTNITVRCDQEAYKPILEKLGATDIVSPQKLAGNSLANSIYMNVDEFYSLAGDYCMVRLNTPSDFHEVNMIDLNARNKYGVNIMLIERGKKEFAPKATDSIKENDNLFVVGKQKDIEKFAKILNLKS